MGSLAGPSIVGAGDRQAQIQERLDAIYSLIHNDIYEEHNKGGPTVAAINKMHEKLRQDDKKLTASNKQKLKSLYATAMADAKNEERVICEALSKIYEIHAINQGRRPGESCGKEVIRRGALMRALQSWVLPLWVGQPGEKPPPLCGAIPAESNYVAKIGEMVAALQKSAEGDENWILAEVLQYNASTSKYEVEDIDEEQKDRLTLSRRRVIPLPLMRACPKVHPEALFPSGSIVMALYPQTTCFYKAVIKALPVTPNDTYEVLFEDANYPDGYSPPFRCAQRYVIANPDKKSK